MSILVSYYAFYFRIFLNEGVLISNVLMWDPGCGILYSGTLAVTSQLWFISWLNTELVKRLYLKQWLLSSPKHTVVQGVTSVMALMSGYYNDVIMTTIASQITSPMFVYSTVYSDADQRKHQSSASLAFVWGIYQDRWIPRTKGQLRGKCFHLMTSSWVHGINTTIFSQFHASCGVLATWS